MRQLDLVREKCLVIELYFEKYTHKLWSNIAQNWQQAFN